MTTITNADVLSLLPRYRRDTLDDATSTSEVHNAIREYVRDVGVDYAAIREGLTPPPTRSAAVAALGVQGVTGPLADLLSRSGGSERAAARVLWLQECASRAVCAEDVYDLLVSLALLEGRGVGGILDAGGEGTARTPFARWLCGKGRKQASDGAAWDAAIQAAGGETVRVEKWGEAGGDWFVLPALDVGEYAPYEDGLLYGWTYPLATSMRITICVAPGATVGDCDTSIQNGSRLAQHLGPRHLRAEALRAAQFAIATGRVEMAKRASKAYALFDRALAERPQVALIMDALGYTPGTW
jgi:hypothetical protein